MKSKSWAVGLACFLLFCVAPASALASSISGRVTGGGAPLERATVCVENINEPTVDECVEGPANGEYKVENLPAGEYRVQFIPPFGSDYLDEYWEGTGWEEEPTTIDLAENQNLTGISVDLRLGGEIAAGVTGFGGGALENAEVCAELIGSEGRYTHCGGTDEEGHLVIAGLTPGSYLVEFEGPSSGPEYHSQFFDDKATEGEAEPIVVDSGERKFADAALVPVKAVVEGFLSAENNVPAGGEACLLETDGTQVECTTLTESGDWRFGVDAGLYVVEFKAPGYTTTYNGEVTEFASARPIQALDERTEFVEGFIFKPSAIAGVVTDAETGAPLESGEVCATATGESPVCAPLEEGGAYLIPVGPGTYTVEFKAEEHRRQFWQGAEEEADAAPVLVEERRVNGISAELRPAVTLGGHLISSGGAALEGVKACAFGAAGFEECALTEEHGFYRMEELPPGEYKVRFTDAGYVPQWYQDEETEAEAEAVTILTGARFTVGARMVPPVAPTNVTPPALSGAGEAGATLSCGTGEWTGTPDTFTYAYSWFRGGIEIPGAGASTYALTTADAGSSVSCTVAATNLGGTASSVPSSNLIAVAAIVEPIITPSGGDSGANGGSNSTPPSPSAPAPVTTPRPAAKKPLQCKKGFHKLKRKGKVRCVKTKAKAGNRKGRNGPRREKRAG